jgi:hypothetical protein
VNQAAAKKIPEEQSGPARRHRQSRQANDPRPLDTTGPYGCRNEYFIRAHIYARSGILGHALSALPAVAAGSFPSSWQEIRSPDRRRLFAEGAQRLSVTQRPYLALEGTAGALIRGPTERMAVRTARSRDSESSIRCHPVSDGEQRPPRPRSLRSAGQASQASAESRLPGAKSMNAGRAANSRGARKNAASRNKQHGRGHPAAELRPACLALLWPRGLIRFEQPLTLTRSPWKPAERPVRRPPPPPQR